jgi:sulfite reductase beta subunit-like hemoprotein
VEAATAEQRSAADRIAADHGLAVDPEKGRRGKGPVGSLENPERYENVPGHVIPILEHEFEDFEGETTKFLRQEIGEDTYIPFRLKQGVYGQRQPEVQMIRVKLPLGGVTPEQLEKFAEVAERFAPLRKGHITTRQNIQLHHIPTSQASEALRVLAEAGLSTREGCGNTMRNVTGDPYAGVCADEPFDITPYATAYVRYFVRHPTAQVMPRKFKTAFAASDADRAITGIHDLGFIPRVRDGVRGAQVVVGGGTSIMPRVAQTVSDFVTLDDGQYLKVAEAIVRLFDRQDWLRKNRARARIKVLVDRIGIEEFRELVEEELQGGWVSERDFDLGRLMLLHDESEHAPPLPPASANPNGDRSEFERFRDSNVSAQRQDGFNTVVVKVPRGDLSPQQFRGLARIMRDFTGGYARTSVEQNLVLRWVRDEGVYDVWTRLRELDLARSGADEISDVVSCPGTDSCKLGITSSMGLNRAVQQRIEEMQLTDPLTRQIQIKMSGCPNGCGQHHIGSIGFYGASLKVGGRQVPAYIPHVGGNGPGNVVFGQRLKSRLPAKRVPDAVERWVRIYESERADGETFNQYAERMGTAHFEEAVKDLAMPVEFSLENLEHFVDWSRSEPYKVERGEGECAV